MGGLSAFRNAQVIVSRHDFATSRATLTCRIPTWLEPIHPAYEKDGSCFGRSFTLTEAGDVSIVPTPGHSLGHQSVILRDQDLYYFFAGDASFDERQLRKGTVAGICEDVPRARATLRRIRAFMADHVTIYLPSHDHRSGERLAHGLVTKT